MGRYGVRFELHVSLVVRVGVIGNRPVPNAQCPTAPTASNVNLPFATLNVSLTYRVPAPIGAVLCTGAETTDSARTHGLSTRGGGWALGGHTRG